MSMTRGPIVPPSTGSSTDLPVALSVNVIVPVTILFPSIDPPLSLCPQAVARFGLENRLLGGDWQTRLLRHRCRLDSLGYPTAALLTAQHLHHPEDAGRGRRSGKRGAQRLGHRAQPHPLLVGKFADPLFEGAGLPRGMIESTQQVGEQPARV